jgi:putative phage-type endonuclease
MQLHQLEQGSPEWHAHRAQHWNASDAPVMLGVSPHKTREQLLTDLHNGVQQEVSDFVQERVLDEGHRTEVRARPLAEAIIGEDLFPVVGTEGRLSASFDGLTMGEDLAYECKQLNQDLRDAMKPGCNGSDLPLHYQVQLEQQCMVSGCKRILFMASEWAGADLVEERHCWYTPNRELAKKIMAGWAVFAADLEAFVPPPPPPPAPVVEVIEALPALMIRVEGKVTSSNIGVFKEAAARFLAGIKTDLKTDDDFANAAQTVKFCQDGEDRLKLVKEQALAQTASIDELFRTVDHITEQLRQKRLALDKLVTERKASIRVEIVQEHQNLLDEFVAGLNTRLGATWIGRTVGGFGEAIKGKRTVESVRAAAAQELANQKLRLNDVSATLFDNRKALKADGQDWFFLFADFATLGTKPVADFKAIADARIAAHKAEVEKKRLQEEERKKREADEAEARLVASEKAAAAVVPAPVPVPSVAAAPDQAALLRDPPPPVPAGFTASQRAHGGPYEMLSAANEQAAIRQGVTVQRPTELPTLKLGDICALFGFTMTADFVRETLKVPHRNTAGAGKLYYESDLPRIGKALLAHIQAKLDVQSPF